MKKSIFEGGAVALVTPFNKSGEVNYIKLKKLIEFQIASGTKALIILGTTGESATISNEERVKIIKFCVYEASKRIPIIIGTGSNSTNVAINLTKQAENLGADGVLVVTPYYNKCNQNGIFTHYKMIAQSTKLPIILYNVPSRTGVNILPKTVLNLSKIKNIVAIKEASGNISQITELLKILPQDFYIYSGDDLLTYPLMCLGAKGVISVTSNCYPKLVNKLCELCLNNKYSEAKPIHDKLYYINKALFLDVNPICVKTYMNLINMEVGNTRLPLTKTTEKNIKELKRVREFYEN